MSESVKYWVIIPAAGSGSRMQSSIPKQYLSVLGKTILEHTLSIFTTSNVIENVMVCLPENDTVFAGLPDTNHNKISTITGGDTRARSVLNGLQAIGAKGNDWVLVHDAARPCFTQQLLNALIESLAEDEVGGIMALPAKDTLKLADPDGRINSTVDRSAIWQAQTPQMFRYHLLKDTLSLALEHSVEITDEASAIEWAGYQPKLVIGDARNLKVTTQDDLALVEFLLSTKDSTIEHQNID